MVHTKKQLDLLTRLALSDDPEERAMLAQKLRMMIGKKTDPKTDIRSVLRDLGVPTNILGYTYLERAVEMQVGSTMPMDITKECYCGIAQEFGTTDRRVERAIRHAIEVASERCEYDTLRRYFGNTIDANRGKPTNAQFITRIAEVIREAQDA